MSNIFEGGRQLRIGPVRGQNIIASIAKGVKICIEQASREVDKKIFTLIQI